MNTPNLTSEISEENPLGKTNSQNRIFASPLAKRLARDLNVNLNSVTGTGPHGRIIKNDIENTATDETAKSTGNLSRNPPSISSGLPVMLPVRGGYTEIPNSSMSWHKGIERPICSGRPRNEQIERRICSGRDP